MRPLVAAALAAAVPSLASAQSPTTVCPNRTGAALVACLRVDFAPHIVYGYDRARDTLFATADDGDPRRITDVYAGRVVAIPVGMDPTLAACNGDSDANPSSCSGSRTINTEHVWPQSLGMSRGTLRADLHNLYPARSDVNTVRGNRPFVAFPYPSAAALYRDSLTVSPVARPADTLAHSASRSGVFMPRASVRGDLARALFYVRTVYADTVEARPERVAFFEGMRATLLAWDRADPPDAAERARSLRVARHQGNVNPFAFDTTLARRAFGQAASPVAADAPPASHSIRAYPSPARTSVHVAGLDAPADVVDALGRIVGRAVPGEALDVSAWAPGVYVVLASTPVRVVVAR